MAANCNLPLAGKVSLVTGATSGIGRAVAELLAERGSAVALTGRDVQRGELVASELQKRGLQVRFLRADLTQAGAAESLVEETIRAFGRIDVLVNNAGVLVNGTALDTSDEAWQQTLDVNLTAPFRLCRAALPIMIDQQSGAIVNVASDWALMGARRALAYSVSKAALAQMTRSLALDHAATGVRVNAVCPGDTDTPMLQREFDAAEIAGGAHQAGPGIPMGRVARAEEVARVVAFLATDEASYMTGSLVAVDGGTSAQ